ncbi:hypothetical protein GCM10022628_07730 [Anoxybacillus suryakundensis]|uniref:Transposase n=1 Tax=Anoxybacillus suryakundensis TaxID=1325335 RepID=A0A0K6GNC6_9BACL|nr:Transposase [Anoxybacillus suryakundensis]
MTRRFDKEFKIHAVRLVVEEGKAVAQTARQLDISPKTRSNLYIHSYA